jgi:hypothetical protein
MEGHAHELGAFEGRKRGSVRAHLHKVQRHSGPLCCNSRTSQSFCVCSPPCVLAAPGRVHMQQHAPLLEPQTPLPAALTSGPTTLPYRSLILGDRLELSTVLRPSPTRHKSNSSLQQWKHQQQLCLQSRFPNPTMISSVRHSLIATFQKKTYCEQILQN